MATVFFSYSHRDESLRDELEIHLAMLKNQCLIETWHDRRILAGDEFDAAIDERLETADVILLLVSPYFLASKYCYSIEMKRAMERHKTGEARVIPVILHPCDWHPAPFGNLLATPTDGKPISKFPNQHDGLLEVVKAVRAALEVKRPGATLRSSPAAPVSHVAAPPVTSQRARSSNLRVKKQFTDHDRDAFLDDNFDYLAKFFEASLAELQARNPGTTTRYRRTDGNSFTGVIYRGGTSISECRVLLAEQMGRQITYSCDLRSNGYNESLSVDDDGHTLFLRPMGMMTLGIQAKKSLSPEGAAEYLWSAFVSPLQR
jgi:hypothetical protein